MGINGAVIIRDNIYGNIEITPNIKRILDCKEFQRLRRISQLATASQVYPGAVQNRFSHSLGVYHLMGKIVSHFEDKLGQIGYERCIQREEKDAILVAALLHDIGHGPFSHAFEKAGIHTKYKPHENWTNEIITSQKTDIHNILIQIWGEDFPEKVIDYIECRRRAKKGFKEIADVEQLNLKLIFSSLVSSQLDADRMDFLLRDSYACGVTYGQFDVDKLIQGMTVALDKSGELRVGVEEEFLPVVEEYFYARYQMYNNVYLHPFKMFTEQLLQRILRMACDLYLNGELEASKVPPVLQEVFNHAELKLKDFCNLDDHVIMGAIQIWSKLGRNARVLSILCESFLNRAGYSQLELTDVEAFCDKFLKESKDKVDLRNDKNGWNEVIYCIKDVKMYQERNETANKEKESKRSSEIYIVRKNGIIITLHDIEKKLDMKNRESYLYYSEELMRLRQSKDVDLFSELMKEFDVYRSVEIEKKYIICKNEKKDKIVDKIQEVAVKMGYAFSEMNQAEQKDIYYDTDNLMLSKTDYSVRIRERKGKYILTSKYHVDSSSNGEGGQLERYESERLIESQDLMANEKCIAQPVKDLLHKYNLDIRDLKERINIKNHRKKCNITKERKTIGGRDEKYELSVDTVQYINLKNHNVYSEVQIEIELKSSYETRITMKGLTDAIMKEFTDGEIIEISDSKYQRALSFTNS